LWDFQGSKEKKTLRDPGLEARKDRTVPAVDAAGKEEGN
jgi:hypothetical protein